MSGKLHQLFIKFVSYLCVFSSALLIQILKLKLISLILIYLIILEHFVNNISFIVKFKLPLTLFELNFTVLHKVFKS